MQSIEHSSLSTALDESCSCHAQTVLRGTTAWLSLVNIGLLKYVCDYYYCSVLFDTNCDDKQSYSTLVFYQLC